MDDLTLLKQPEGSDSTQAHVLEHLVGVVQKLSLARSVEAVQEVVRRAARELTGADGATFVLRDGEQCFYADEDAIAPLWKGLRFPMSACISGWSMIHRQPAVIEDIYADPRIPADAYRPTFVKSLAMVPIRSVKPIGAIGNYWARRHRTSNSELKLLQALADSTSIALENVALLEDLERARRTAETANRLKDEFLAMLSHELRTPLNPILGWADLISEGDLSTAEIAEAGKTIQENAKLQTRLIDDLMDVAQLVSGTLHLEVSDVEIAPLVERVVGGFMPQVAQSEIRLDCQFDPAIGRVACDARRLEQIVWNLVSNAIKFSPRGGRIEVLLARAESGVEITVSDSGQGIAGEFLPHAFEPFRQAEGGFSRRVGGLGLGLTLVHHLVELHGGSVSIQSAGKAQGTRCKVRLLRSPPSAEGVGL